MVGADTIAALVLNFTAAATTILRQKDRSKLPPLFQSFLITLIWAGFCSGFISLHFLVRIEGWALLGIVYWLVSGFVFALISLYIAKRSDDMLVVISLITLVVGLFFWLQEPHKMRVLKSNESARS